MHSCVTKLPYLHLHVKDLYLKTKTQLPKQYVVLFIDIRINETICIWR